MATVLSQSAAAGGPADPEFERKHPRGQPDNPGQFAPAASASRFAVSGPQPLQSHQSHPHANRAVYRSPENRGGTDAFHESYTGPRWTYGFQNRPPGYSHNPEGFITGSQAKHAGYNFGTMDWPFPLTAEEQAAFELTPVHREGQLIEIPPTPIVRGYGGTLKIHRVGDGKAIVGYPDAKPEHLSAPSAAVMPEESLPQFVGDLTGRFFSRRASKDPDVEQVRLGKAEILGKGDDGVAFGVGDKVVKMSTVVPYVWSNPGQRTPDEAADMLSEDYATAHLMRKAGVPGIPEQKLVYENTVYGPKTFIVMPRFDVPDKLTPAQLEETRQSIEAMHKAGWTLNDQIQVGVDKDGHVWHYDTGKASKSDKQWDRDSDLSALRTLYENNGVEFPNAAREALESWDWMVEGWDTPVGDADREMWMEQAKDANRARRSLSLQGTAAQRVKINRKFEAQLAKLGFDSKDFFKPSEMKTLEHPAASKPEKAVGHGEFTRSMESLGHKVEKRRSIGPVPTMGLEPAEGKSLDDLVDDIAARGWYVAKKIPSLNWIEAHPKIPMETPAKAYHVTPLSRARSIESQGLKLGGADTARYGGESTQSVFNAHSEGRVFATNSPHSAAHWAHVLNNSSTDWKEPWVMYEIDMAKVPGARAYKDTNQNISPGSFWTDTAIPPDAIKPVKTVSGAGTKPFVKPSEPPAAPEPPRTAPRARKPAQPRAPRQQEGGRVQKTLFAKTRESVLRYLKTAYPRFYAKWDAEKHPRGQPKNAGQFTSGGASPGKKPPAAPAKTETAATSAPSAGTRVDVASLSPEFLTAMSRKLKSLGYDSRGADDVRSLLSTRMAPDGVLQHPDWIKAYEAAGAAVAKRRSTVAAKAETKDRTPNVRWERIRELGVTGDPNEAGYLTPTGSMVDLSGKKNGGPAGVRHLDHREAGGAAGMQELQAAGYVRWFPEAGGFDLRVAPTAAQERLIAKLAQSRRGEVAVDLFDGLGEWDEGNEFYREPARRWGKVYDVGTNPAVVLNDIRDFYAGKEMPQPADEPARYAESESEPEEPEKPRKGPQWVNDNGIDIRSDWVREMVRRMVIEHLMHNAGT